MVVAVQKKLNRIQRGGHGYRRGHRAEIWAAWWLRMKGYRILARCWRCPAGEIDLVAYRNGVLVAVEVKARPDIATGLESIRVTQQKRLATALEYFAHRRSGPWEGLRLDAMIICPWRLPHHLPDAWQR